MTTTRTTKINDGKGDWTARDFLRGYKVVNRKRVTDAALLDVTEWDKALEVIEAGVGAARAEAAWLRHGVRIIHKG